MSRSIVVATVLLACSLGSGALARPPLFRIVEVRGERSIMPYAVNDSDLVVGQIDDLACSWKAGTATVLDLPPAPENPGPFDDCGMKAKAYAVNNDGLIAGTSGPGCPIVMSGLSTTYVTLWKGSKLIKQEGLGGLPPGLNNRGGLVGADEYRGFALVGGTSVSIGTLSKLPQGNGSTACGINDSGLIVGASTAGDGKAVHVFTLRMHRRMQDLGGIRGTKAVWPAAINNHGEIVGYTSDQFSPTPLRVSNYHSHAFRSIENHLVRLLEPTGALLSQADAVNNSGWIVGSATSKAGSRAVLWIDGHPVFLDECLSDDGGWKLLQATGVNNHGHIVGYGLKDGHQAGFLLIPEPPHGKLH